MAGEWHVVPLGQLVDIYDGPHATPPKTDAGPIFLGISNLTQGRLDLSSTEHLAEQDFKRWTRRVTPESGDIVFSYETRLGEAALIPSGLRCWLGRRMGLLRVPPGAVDSRFLLYAYLGPEFQATLYARIVHGSTVDRIPLIDMPKFPIRIPRSIEEQRAIAHILGTLDDKIELNRRMNETLEEMARAIFKSWFVDFDPVRAKAEGRDPGLPEHIADLFPDRFEDSELGEVPAGWNVMPIGEAVRVVGGGTPSTKELAFWEGGIHCWATPKDLSKLQDPILLDTERKVTDAGLAKISSGLLPVGAVLLSSRAPVGYLAIARVPVSVNQGFIAMVCEKSLTHHYVLYWALSNMKSVEGRASGSTFQEISKKNFRPILALVPTDGALDTFEEQVSPLYDKIAVNLQQSRTLAAIRDALLPRLISGEVRVWDAEALEERAAR